MRADLLRLVDGRRRALVVAAVALLALVVLSGGAGAYAYANADVETYRTDTFRPVRQSLHTSVPVRTNTTLYPPGTWIEDASLYPKSGTGSPRIAVETSFPDLVGKTDVSQVIRIRIRATRDGNAFWRRFEELAATRRTVTGGGRVTTNATLSIERLESLARTIKETYGDRGVVRATLSVRTRYEDQKTTRTIATELPIETGREAFSIGTGSDTTTGKYSVVRRRTRREPMESAMPFLSASGVCLLALVVVLGGVVLADDSRSDVDYLLCEYGDWVSEVEHADAPLADPDVRHETVGDLVHTAIDAETRVIYSHADRAFYARVGPELHVFRP